MHLIQNIQRAVPEAINGMINVSVEAANEIVELLKEQETMVRCKDCKYWKNKYTKYIVHPWLPCMEINTKGNWFCADGERAVKWDEADSLTAEGGKLNGKESL